MPYESVDKLQNALVEHVFHYARDSKKAAGRALGTIVEIITYYLVKTWDLEQQVSIERGLEEYGNPDITHNVEFSLHPVCFSHRFELAKSGKSVTANAIFKAVAGQIQNSGTFKPAGKNSLLSGGVLRNACTVATAPGSYLLCRILSETPTAFDLEVYQQHRKPYAVFECKRVGVEEGMRKGPQTIEKAKQGAYVARSASSLQKIRTESGDLHGIIYRSDGSYIIKPFVDLLDEIISSSDPELLRRFILTIGVVSNHGNWFTSENQNKELKVLAQSYDWLLFLTDKGLSEFITRFLLKPAAAHKPVQEAFVSSYAAAKKSNQFTKVRMNRDADRVLTSYFAQNRATVEGWFNVISPARKKLAALECELNQLKSKPWNTILT